MNAHNNSSYEGRSAEHSKEAFVAANQAVTRNISFAAYAPAGIATIETQSQRSPRRQNSSQLIDKRALQDRGSRFGDKRMPQQVDISTVSYNRSQEIHRRSMAQASSMMPLKKLKQHENIVGSALGVRDGGPQARAAAVGSTQNTRQAEVVNMEVVNAATPSSITTGQQRYCEDFKTCSRQANGPQQQANNAKEFTYKLQNLKETLTCIKSNLNRRSKSKTSLFSNSNANGSYVATA